MKLLETEKLCRHKLDFDSIRYGIFVIHPVLLFF